MFRRRWIATSSPWGGKNVAANFLAAPPCSLHTSVHLSPYSTSFRVSSCFVPSVTSSLANSRSYIVSHASIPLFVIDRPPALTVAMAESSKGKQPSRSHRPSRLGDELQVPNSDTVVPDTQLQAINSDYRPEHQHEDLDADTLAFLERTTAKRLGTATSSSQSVLAHTFGISKPTPVNLVEPGFCYMSMKRAAKKTPQEDNASDLQPPHHPNTAGYSIEHDSSEAHKQGTNEHAIETL